MNFTEAEKATIIHSLRLFQEEIRPKYGQYGKLDSTSAPIFDDVSPLSDKEINKLCARLSKGC